MRPAQPSLSALQPLVLVVLCWGLTGLAAALALARLSDLDLVQTFMLREGISATVFEPAGVIWILFGVLAYAIGDLAARFGAPEPVGMAVRVNHDRAARVTFLANLVLLGVTAAWIASSAAKAGGLMQLAAAAYADSLTTRDLLLENKLFTGMRLFYAALPATAALAAGLLASGKLSRRRQRQMRLTLAINAVALLILPLVMSQRLLLLQLLLSSYFAACMVRGRIFGLQWGLLGVGLFLLLWVGREAITNPLVQRSAIDIASQKLAFYVVNDMFNAVAPVSVPIQNTNGGLLLEGVMFLTFTDGYFLELLGPRLAALDPVLGGGEFPFFTAAYVDFGAKGGAIFICLAGFALRRLYMRGTRHFGWSVVYAQTGAALIFSSHSVYFMHQNFFFSVALIGVVVAMASQRVRRVASSAPNPVPAAPGRSFVPVFRSRRARGIMFGPAE